MMNLVGMGIFARVAEAKSFSGAARRLGLSKSLDDEVIWQAVLGGLGVSILPTFTVGEDLQSGRLQAVLADYIPPGPSLYAVYLPNRHLSAKVRVFIDYLLARFQPPAYWDRGWSTPRAEDLKQAVHASS